MPLMGIVGELFLLKDEIEWKVNEFFSLLWLANGYYKSPSFKFLDRSWSVVIYPIGQVQHCNSGWAEIHVVLEEPCPRLPVQCTISLKNITGKLVNLCCGTFEETIKACGTVNAFMVSELINRRNELVPSDALTIVLTLKETIPHSKEGDLPNRLKENVCHSLKNILSSGKRSDVIFIVGSRHFAAHRLILESRSPVFATMFKVEMREKKTGVVKITDMDPDVFKLVLSYIYCGEVAEISPDQACHVFEAANKYELEDLKDWCICFMKEHLSVNTVFDVFALADLYEVKELKKLADDYLMENSANILDTDKWKIFAAQRPGLAIQILASIVKQIKVKH